MPIPEKLPAPKKVQIGSDFPTDAPLIDDQLHTDKWWFDTRTVLRRDREFLENLANDLAALQKTTDARIAALEARVQTLEAP